MRGVFVGAVALLALAGCKSTADRNAEADGYCQSIGARPGSDAYMQCRLVQQQRQDARRAAGLRMMNEGLSDVQRSVAGGRPVNCTSRRGNFDTVDTTCY